MAEPEALPSLERRRTRLFHIVTLTPLDDGRGLTLSLDIPPCLHPRAQAGSWPDEDVVEHAEWEVRQLAHAPTPGLVSIRFAGPPAMHLDADNEAVRCSSSPPVCVIARISGPPGNPYHCDEGLQVRLLLDKHYPATPPEVNFMQTVHHFFLDNDNGLPSIFYELLQDLVSDFVGEEEGVQHTLRATLQLLHHILQSPLHPCEGCQEQFDGYASMHAERAKVIHDYIAHRANPELFDGSSGWRDEWLHPELRAALCGDGEAAGGAGPVRDAAAARQERLRGLLHECAEGIYSFPMLTDEACAMLVGEVRPAHVHAHAYAAHMYTMYVQHEHAHTRTCMCIPYTACTCTACACACTHAST